MFSGLTETKKKHNKIPSDPLDFNKVQIKDQNIWHKIMDTKLSAEYSYIVCKNQVPNLHLTTLTKANSASTRTLLWYEKLSSYST